MTHFARPTFQITLILMLCLAGSGHAWAESDQLVMTINGTPYSHRQLFGMDARELRSQFDSEVRKYTDEALYSYLENSAYLRHHPEARGTLATRQKLESTVFESAYQVMLDFACRHLVLAHLGDEILRRHHTKAAEFFNLDAPPHCADSPDRADRFLIRPSGGTSCPQRRAVCGSQREIRIGGFQGSMAGSA